MRCVRNLCFMVTLFLFLIVPPSKHYIVQAQEPSQANRITDIQIIDRGPTRIEIDIRSESILKIEPLILQDPTRLYVDFLGTRIESSPSETELTVSHPMVRRARKVFNEDPDPDQEWVALDALILDLVREEPYRVLEQSENRFVLEVGTLNKGEWQKALRRRLAGKANTVKRTSSFKTTPRSSVEQELYDKIKEEMRQQAGLDPQEPDKTGSRSQMKPRTAQEIPSVINVLLKQEVITYSNYSQASLLFSRKAKVIHYAAEKPNRLIIDLLDKNVYSVEPPVININGPRVTKIETIYFLGEEAQPDGARRVDAISLHLKNKLPYKLKETDREISIRFGRKQDIPSASSEIAAPIHIPADKILSPEEKTIHPVMPKPHLSARSSEARPHTAIQGPLVREENEQKIVEKVSKRPPEDKNEAYLKNRRLQKQELYDIVRNEVDARLKELRTELTKTEEAQKQTVKQVLDLAKEHVDAQDYGPAQEKVEGVLEVLPQNQDALRLKNWLRQRQELYDIVREEVDVRLEGLQAGRIQAEEAAKRMEIQEDLEEAKKMIKDLSLDAVVGIVLDTRETELTEEEAIRIGLENYGALRASEAERSAAQARVAESRRARYPNATFKLTNTTGAVFDVGFEERTYGVEVEQPLYTSGVLSNTIRQAHVNLNLVGDRYEKVVQEHSFRITEAYYDLMKAQMSHEIQRELWDEGQGAKVQAEARFKKGLSRRLEILNVQTQINQIGFQLASSERDLLLARYKFKELVGGGEGPFYRVPGIKFPKELHFEPLEIELEQVLALSEENNPGIRVAKQQAQVSSLEERIARGKGGLRVDLTGFLGQAGSNFETEGLDLNSEHSIGIRITRPFGLNTVSTSITDDEAAQRLGETDKKSSTVRSFEFNVLDGLKGKGDLMDARAAHLRTEEELKDVLFNIAVETQEAFYGYQEAVLRVRNAIEKVKFQKEAVKVVETEAGLNTALTSDVLSAKVKLADEESLYVQALANYNLSIAKLNKAVGISGYYKADRI